MFKLFRKPEPVEIVDPLVRLERAVDEVNAALDGMPSHLRNIRPFFQSGALVSTRRGTLVLGRWNRQYGDVRFEVTYGERAA